MIEHVYRRAVASPVVSDVIVATDDLRIATVVAGFGGNVRITHGDHYSATDRIAEVAASLDCDIVVNVQGGGLEGQAGAVKHALSRVLVLFNPELRPSLKKAGFLTRDSRIKERKKYGLRGARRGCQYSKR